MDYFKPGTGADACERIPEGIEVFAVIIMDFKLFFNIRVGFLDTNHTLTVKGNSSHDSVTPLKRNFFKAVVVIIGIINQTIT